MQENKKPKKKAGRNTDKKPMGDKKKKAGGHKNARDNQWTSAAAGIAGDIATGRHHAEKNRERRDGPGGEDAK